MSNMSNIPDYDNLSDEEYTSYLESQRKIDDTNLCLLPVGWRGYGLEFAILEKSMFQRFSTHDVVNKFKEFAEALVKFDGNFPVEEIPSERQWNSDRNLYALTILKAIWMGVNPSDVAKYLDMVPIKTAIYLAKMKVMMTDKKNWVDVPIDHLKLFVKHNVNSNHANGWRKLCGEIDSHTIEFFLEKRISLSEALSWKNAEIAPEFAVEFIKAKIPMDEAIVKMKKFPNLIKLEFMPCNTVPKREQFAYILDGRGILYFYE